MGFISKVWKDRKTEYPNRRTLTKEDGSTELVTVAREEGTISEEGDAFNADTMNDLEQRILDAIGSGEMPEELGTDIIEALIAINESLNGFKYYSDPAQFGSSYDATPLKLFTALPRNSVFIGQTSDFTDASWGMPTQYGMLWITKYYTSRVRAEVIINDQSEIWIAKLVADETTGVRYPNGSWEKLAMGSDITGGASTIVSSNLTASRALVSNSSGKVAVSAVTATELGYLAGVTSKVQAQFDKITSLLSALSSITLSGYATSQTVTVGSGKMCLIFTSTGALYSACGFSSTSSCSVNNIAQNTDQSVTYEISGYNITFKRTDGSDFRVGVIMLM